MKIKINERFEIERERYQWTLREWIQGETREGELKLTARESYYPRLSTVCHEIIERSGDMADSLANLIGAINFARLEIALAVKGFDLHPAHAVRGAWDPRTAKQIEEAGDRKDRREKRRQATLWNSMAQLWKKCSCISMNTDAKWDEAALLLYVIL